jgi:hypothetical protein
MANIIEYRGLNELIAQMRAFPQKLKQVAKIGMEASLNTLWENVPSYPTPPDGSSYRRTGTLGKSLGSSEGGGSAGGKPSIYEVKQAGVGGFVEGRFGTTLDYAPYVIGPTEGAKGERQAWMHKDRWWQLEDIIPKSKAKIDAIWTGIAQKMADFLNSRSSGVK